MLKTKLSKLSIIKIIFTLFLINLRKIISNLAIILLMSDEFFMKLALDEAWKYQLLTYPNPAVGCAIVDKNGKLLALGAHKCAGLAHA